MSRADNAVEQHVAPRGDPHARAQGTTGDSTPLMVSVLIVDDHALITHGLSYALSAQGLDVHVAADTDIELVLALARAHRPSLALVDLQLGAAVDGGMALIAQLSRTTPVLVLTGVQDQTLLEACVDAGAAGIASKAEGYDRLLEHIGAVLRGHRAEALRRGAAREDR